MTTAMTIEIEDRNMPQFFRKIPVSIDRGEGVRVWDEDGKTYLDFTAGWGVTSIGHAHPVISRALVEQSRKIIQNPSSGLTYSPARARLLSLMKGILPAGLTRAFFSSSGAEANDAAIKLARKATGRPDIISTLRSFHGRTISTTSATGQARHRDRFAPLMPHNRFVPYDDLSALERSLDDGVAAVILEPVQGEGGVRVPSGNYLEEAGRLCRKNGSLLIIDEIQTGFCRTGPMFAVSPLRVEADFLTMAKGIAGGFPFGAFAVSEAVASRLEPGDHGGTYCGNPLGCAVASAVIEYLLENDISANVARMGNLALLRMEEWPAAYPETVTSVRGKGLLLAVEFRDEMTATNVNGECLANGLLVNQVQGNVIRLFPALNIRGDEMEEGLGILGEAIKRVDDRYHRRELQA
jgi:acetylornithine/N-succinyldiaminopimelate aminotransferase